MYSLVPNNREGLNKRGGSTDNLNINTWGGGQIKGGGLKNVLGQKWQPVISNYGCPKQNFFAPSRYS